MLPQHCKGTYRYRRDGVVLGVTDTFVVDGSRVRSTRIQPGGARMDVDAHLNPSGLVEAFGLRWTHEGEGHIPSREVHYQVSAGELRVAIDDQEIALDVGDDALLFPLLRIFQGAVILAVASSGNAGRTVIIPDLHDLTNPTRLLHPTVEVRTADCLELAMDGGPATYSYKGSVYDAEARFFIDPVTSLMTGYHFPQPDGSAFDITLELDL